MPSTYDTTSRAFAWVSNELRTQYLGRRKKETTSCGFPINAVPMAYWTFDKGSQFLVAKVFQDAFSILSSLGECAGSGMFVVAAIMFVERFSSTFCA